MSKIELSRAAPRKKKDEKNEKDRVISIEITGKLPAEREIVILRELR